VLFRWVLQAVLYVFVQQFLLKLQLSVIGLMELYDNLELTVLVFKALTDSTIKFPQNLAFFQKLQQKFL
jgi:hypothetical protein